MSWAINWLVRPIVGVLLGRAFVEALHVLGYFPDRWLGQWIAQMIAQPSAEMIELAKWGIAATVGLALLGIYEVYRWRPLRLANDEINRQAVNSTGEAATGAVVRDVDISEALAYIAFRAWGRGFDEVVASPNGAAEYDEFLQAAADGQIPIWGRRETYGVLEPIPAEYWRHHRLDWFTLVKGQARTEVAHARPPHYEGLMTSRSAVQRQWPQSTSRPAI